MTVTSFNIYQQITSVRLVSVGNLTGIYYNGQLNNGVGSYLLSDTDGQLTVDGVNVNVGDRILLSGQTNTNENGIYVVDQIGDVVTPFLLKRAPDLQNIEQLKTGQYFSVGGGNSFAGALYVIIEPLPDIIGVDPILFIETSAGGFGPYLRVDENLSDVASKLTSYQNLGFGSGDYIILDETDFNPQFFLPNPCPNLVDVNLTTPGTYSLILPPMTGETAFNLAQGLVIANTGTQNFGLFAFEGPFQPSVTPGQVYKYFLIEAEEGGFQWERVGVVTSVNGKTGNVELFGSSSGVYVANSGSNINGDGSIINPYQTLSFAMSQITDASPTNPYSINLLTGDFSDTDLTLKSNVFIFGNSSTLNITNQVTLDPDWSAGGSGGIFDLYDANFAGGMALDFDSLGALDSVFAIKNVRANVASTWAFQGKITTGITRILIEDIYSSSFQPTMLLFDCFGYANNCVVDSFSIYNTNSQNTSFYANNLITTNDLLSQASDTGNLNFFIANSRIFGTATFSSMGIGSCTSLSSSVVYASAPVVSGEPTLLSIDLIGFPIVPTGGATVNYVTTAISSWDGSNDPVDVVGGSGIDLNGGTINAVVNTWDGSTTPVDVTAGDGIDITDGVISLTGSGASAAYGGSFTNNNIYTTSFTDASTWKGIRVNNFSTVVTNFVIGFDGSNQIYYEYVGLETAKFRIGLTNRIRTVNNVNPNTYNYSLGIDSGSGIVPIYLGLAIMQFVTQGNDDLDAILVPYNMIVELNPNDKLYPIIQNRGDVNPTNNEYIVKYLLADIEKIGDVGGAAAGVTSLNGLTGTLAIAGPDGSVSISTSGDDINLSVGQYIQVTGTSQAMLANKSYICMNTSTTSLSLPTTCPVGGFVEIAGYGGTVGTFIITQGAGQAIFMGTTNTTFGATGTLTTDTVGGSNLLSALKLVCVQADTYFMVVSSQGNFVLS